MRLSLFLLSTLTCNFHNKPRISTANYVSNTLILKHYVDVSAYLLTWCGGLGNNFWMHRNHSKKSQESQKKVTLCISITFCAHPNMCTIHSCFMWINNLYLLFHSIRLFYIGIPKIHSTTSKGKIHVKRSHLDTCDSQHN